MSFGDFYGNRETVNRLREMLAQQRLPHAVILAGPEGSGKFTLAQMLAKAMNCLAPPASRLPDFCGSCANCRRIAEADDLDARCAEAMEAREALREADRRETRLFVQTHPDVLIVPPDPPQMMIKVDQVRQIIAGIYYRPSAGREKVYIFPSAVFMKEAANALLKVLEEPPEFATLLLLTENPGALLPTIRSRALTFWLRPLPAAEVERYLAERRREWSAKQRALVAQLAGGAIGRALSFDLAAYTEARNDAVTLLRSWSREGDHTSLFRATENYRSGAEGREKTEDLVRTLYWLLEDVLVMKSGAPELVRNRDLLGELKPLAAAVDFDWVAAASDSLAQVERGLRFNLLRSLSLDAFALSLERA